MIGGKKEVGRFQELPMQWQSNGGNMFWHRKKLSPGSCFFAHKSYICTQTHEMDKDVTIRVEKTLHDKAKAKARENGQTVKGYIGTLIKKDTDAKPR